MLDFTDHILRFKRLNNTGVFNKQLWELLFFFFYTLALRVKPYWITEQRQAYSSTDIFSTDAGFAFVQCFMLHPDKIHHRTLLLQLA